MSIIVYASDFILPAVFIIIIAYGYIKKINIYETFITGAKEGLLIVFNILPTLIGLLLAVGIFRASGALTFLSKLISPVTDIIHFPTETVPLLFMRTVSSSAATGLLLDLFKQFGPDSFIGRFVSVMMSCTETVFYTLSVYYLSVRITKTRYTVSGALIANFAGVAASLVITMKLFGK